MDITTKEISTRRTGSVESVNYGCRTGNILPGKDRSCSGRIRVGGKVMGYAAIHIIEVNHHWRTSLDRNGAHVKGKILSHQVDIVGSSGG